MKVGPRETNGPSFIILSVLSKLDLSSHCILNDAAGRRNFFYWAPGGELIHSLAMKYSPSHSTLYSVFEVNIPL